MSETGCYVDSFCLSLQIALIHLSNSVFPLFSSHPLFSIRKLLKDCCDPGQFFAMTKENSPVGKNLWFDGEFLYSFTIDNKTYSLFPKVSNDFCLTTYSF